jgi:hypothetical protein
MQSIKIRVKSLEVDGAPFEAPFGAALVRTFGAHDRYTDSLLSFDRSQFIRTHICDNTGIVYYMQHPELLLTHCYFSFVTEDTRVQPYSPFAGWIQHGLNRCAEIATKQKDFLPATGLSRDLFDPSLVNPS